MKKYFRRSITARITAWVMIVLMVIVTLTLLIFRYVSASILQKTIREYLISSVEENTDKIRFLQNPSDKDRESADTDNIFINYQDGWLEIDDDFLDRINDVESALYTGDGTMLYGKNPIARSMEDEAFAASRIYRYTTGAGSFYVYDRKLTGGLNDLWIRGVVPLSSEEMQLYDIFRTVTIFMPVLVLLGIAGSWLAAARALLPVRRIEQTVSEITRGTDLKRRIEIGDVDRELYDLSSAFNAMLDRLEHSFEAEQQFTSDASHELRTPMSVMMAQTELILEKERTPEEYRRAFEVIRRQGKRMSALIGSMLDYTRIELSPENYPLTRMDFSALVRATAEDMALIKIKNITLKTDMEENIYVMGNSMLLERAVQNLIDNAYKYGKENGHITVCLHSPAAFSVTDDGIGISKEEIGHIFERFYRGDTSRTGNNAPYGAGLGLSMVKKIIEIHRGTVNVISTEGEGTSISFFLERLP